MKTEQEIRERIAMRQQEIDEEELNGGVGTQDWCEAMADIKRLHVTR